MSGKHPNGSRPLKYEFILTCIFLFKGFDPDDKLEINDADFAGPLPTKVEKRKDIYLTFSLAFLALLSVVITARTKTCQDVCSSIKERLSRLWRSVERQKQD